MTKVTREQAKEAWKWIQMMIETNYDTAAQKRLDQFFSQTCETCKYSNNGKVNHKQYDSDCAYCSNGKHSKWEPKGEKGNE